MLRRAWARLRRRSRGSPGSAARPRVAVVLTDGAEADVDPATRRRMIYLAANLLPTLRPPRRGDDGSAR